MAARCARCVSRACISCSSLKPHRCCYCYRCRYPPLLSHYWSMSLLHLLLTLSRVVARLNVPREILQTSKRTLFLTLCNIMYKVKLCLYELVDEQIVRVVRVSPTVSPLLVIFFVHTEYINNTHKRTGDRQV